MDLNAYIRDVPDFPKKGILFKDITPLLGDAKAFDAAIEGLAAKYRGQGISAIAGIESRGFILGAALALKLNVGFIPIRKPGKLPYKTKKREYSLEYGKDAIEIHEDAVKPGQKVLLVDDVIATGGTARAAADLLKEMGANLVGIAFLIELSFLKGAERLKGEPVFSLLRF
ncbi:MAG TPA: adenine phosphoribosyltransferase [Candidatus Ozemobacteraceae bacterium]|nr:adenine phosphoribosyltransferase [Candidatus Ozemobacteraceae bacterium]